MIQKLENKKDIKKIKWHKDKNKIKWHKDENLNNTKIGLDNKRIQKWENKMIQRF